MVDWNCCRSRAWFGLLSVESGQPEGRSPCGLIASSRGWPIAEIWNNRAYGWEVHPSYAASWITFIKK
jgi:hypothetical protein